MYYVMRASAPSESLYIVALLNKVMFQYGGSLTFNVTVIFCGSIVLTTVLLYLQIKNI